MATNNDESQINPFFAVRIGASVDSETGRIFTSVIADKPITRLQLDTHMKTSMTGESSYVYSDTLNQGSLGVSGSYGTAAASKISAAVSAYAGNSSANNQSSINLNYNIQVLTGVEYINFDELTAETLLSSLKESPKQHAVDALEKFTKVNSLLAGTDLIAALKDAAKKAVIEEALKAWTESIQNFFSLHGDGIVVGVMWGGIGYVSLNIKSKAEENNWKYGGKGNFSYEGAASSVSVEAAYDGSQRKASTGVEVTIRGESYGNCVGAQVAEWTKSLQAIGSDKILQAKPLDTAPKLAEIKDTPKIPTFQKPEKEPSVASKVEAIKDLAGLKAFAIASAYDTAKKDANNKDLTLDEFIKQSEKKADAAPVAQLNANAAANNMAVLGDQHPANANQVRLDALHSALSAAPQEADYLLAPSLVVDGQALALEAPVPVADGDFVPEIYAIQEQPTVNQTAAQPKLSQNSDVTKDFTVLGVWITNWADLFPWLATGYLNKVENIGPAKEILKKQCMIQDFLTLSKLYRTIASTGIKHDNLGFSADFTQTADSFSQQVAVLKKDLSASTETINAVYNKLNKDAKAIYKRWDEIKFLRSAELGLGLMYKEKSITDTITKQELVNTYTEITCKMDSCSFSEGASYSPFSKFLKLLPLITPNGDIYAFGPASMLLKGTNTTDGASAVFSRNAATALKLEVDIANRILKTNEIKLYPIPFSAAEGINWKGQSVSTNLGSNKSLQERLTALNKELSKMNMYSFSSDNWRNWKPGSFYSINSIKTQYIGIIEQVGSVFKKQ